MNWYRTAGIILFVFGLVGVLFLIVSFPLMPLSDCGDAGVPDQTSTFEFEEISDGWIVYTPDGGGTECGTPFFTVLTPIVAFFVGGLIIVDWVSRNF